MHRDLKPENLFLTNDGRIKILDFGVAKLQVQPEDQRSIENLTTVTKSGTVIGTVAYMSPEQLRSKPVDHRSDIFSFGAILYEMVTGRRAFRGETEVDTMTAVLREEPPDANLEQAAIPAGYRDVVKHCLEKEPENRFQSVKDLAFALQTLSGSSPLRRDSLRGAEASDRPCDAMGARRSTGCSHRSSAVAQLLRIPAPPPVYRRLTFEAGTVYAARFASNGDSIVYSAAWNGKPVQIFSTVGNSLLAQPLNLSDANLLSVSRSTNSLWCSAARPPGRWRPATACWPFRPLAGGSPREVLSDVRWADWNAGGELGVVHYVEGHSRLEYPIGNVLYQAGGWISNIRFSPRGDKIAFMDHPALWDNRGTVCVVDLAGHVRTLSREWESESGLAWRPDGNEIWFTAVEKGNNLNLMAVDFSAKVRTLLNLPVGLVLQDIASDGRVLAASKSQRLAMSFSALGSKEDVDLSWHDWDSARDISSDGRFVLFEDASEAAGPGYSVMLRKVDGTLPVRLGEGSTGGMSPDGKWAASISTSKAAQITLFPTGAGQPRTINVSGLQHIQNGWARFLPDGQRLSVNANEVGHATPLLLRRRVQRNRQSCNPGGSVVWPGLTRRPIHHRKRTDWARTLLG